jgi:hypothetical protein
MRARFGGAVLSVGVYASDSTGAVGPFLTQLFDDGDVAVHQDAVDGDGIFSNAYSQLFEAVGTYNYIAVPDDDMDRKQRATVDAMAPLDPAHEQALIDLAVGAQRQLDTAISGGLPSLDALHQVEESLRLSPDVYLPSLTTTSQAVAWRSTEGLDFTVIAFEEGTRGRAAGLLKPTTDGRAEPAPAAGPGPTPAAPAPADDGEDTCNPKGEFLVVCPYFCNYEPPTIAAAAEAADWDVTFHCLWGEGSKGSNPAGSLCGNQPVTLSDFKDWSRYAGVVVASHGSDAPTNLLLTAIDYSSNLLGDWWAQRIVLFGNEVALTRKWFSAYANQLNGAAVYFGSCFSTAGGGGGFPGTFSGLGAGVFAGFSLAVGSNFAETCANGM